MADEDSSRHDGTGVNLDRLVYSRTAELALADASLTPEERTRLREQLEAAGSYERLTGWAKRRYEAAYVGFVLKYGDPRGGFTMTADDYANLDNELYAIHQQHLAEERAEAAEEIEKRKQALRRKYPDRVAGAQFTVDAKDLDWSSCATCSRKSAGPRCEAFPHGIPDEILEGRDRHTRPHRGDRGLLYLPKVSAR